MFNDNLARKRIQHRAPLAKAILMCSLTAAAAQTAVWAEDRTSIPDAGNQKITTTSELTSSRGSSEIFTGEVITDCP